MASTCRAILKAVQGKLLVPKIIDCPEGAFKRVQHPVCSGSFVLVNVNFQDRMTNLASELGQAF
jgi:hypothetical protein